MNSKLLTTVFVLLISVVSFSSYAIMRWWQDESGKLPVYSANQSTDLTMRPHQVVDFSLLNQNNVRSGTENWNGKIAIVNFFFTHCAGVCPKMTHNIKLVQEACQDDTSIVINSLTVDPGTDSVAQLKLYADRFGIQKNNWHLLTGDKKLIYRLARNEFMILATDGDGGANDFIHSEKIVLLDTHRRIRGYYAGTNITEVKQLIKDILKLKHEN